MEKLGIKKVDGMYEVAGIKYSSLRQAYHAAKDEKNGAEGFFVFFREDGTVVTNA